MCCGNSTSIQKLDPHTRFRLVLVDIVNHGREHHGRILFSTVLFNRGSTKHVVVLGKICSCVSKSISGVPGWQKSWRALV